MKQTVLKLPDSCSIYLNIDGLPVLQDKIIGIAEQIISRRVAIMLLVGCLCESVEKQLKVYSEITKVDTFEAQKVYESTRTYYKHILRKGMYSNTETKLCPDVIGHLIKNIIEKASKNESLHPIRMYSPKTLTWIATYQCTYNCKYCYLQGHKTKKQKNISYSYLPFERLRELFKEAGQIGIRHITITGGEPLDYPYILTSIETIKDLGIKLSLTTKKYISKDLISLFSHEDAIGISLDSCYPQIVSKLTGSKKAFSEMNSALSNLSNSSCKKSIEVVVTTINYLHVLDTIEYAESQNIDEIRLLRVMRSVYRDFNKLLLTDQEWQFLCDKVHEKYPNLKKGKMSISPFPTTSYGTDPPACSENITYADTGTKPLKSFTCPKLDRDMVFDSSGNVYACYRIPEIVIGSIRNSSISEVWQSKSLREITFPTRAMYQDTICYDCEYFDKCIDKNRCLYYSLLAYGRYFIPDPFACCRKRTCFPRDYMPIMNPV